MLYRFCVLALYILELQQKPWLGNKPLLAVFPAGCHLEQGPFLRSSDFCVALLRWLSHGRIALLYSVLQCGLLSP